MAAGGACKHPPTKPNAALPLLICNPDIGEVQPLSMPASHIMQLMDLGRPNSTVLGSMMLPQMRKDWIGEFVKMPHVFLETSSRPAHVGHKHHGNLQRFVLQLRTTSALTHNTIYPSLHRSIATPMLSFAQIQNTSSINDYISLVCFGANISRRRILNSLIDLSLLIGLLVVLYC